ncbi:MAG: peptide deformylase [Deltaproteobacteria bacterium]|nr:peptide deformylase [Deltaproteobacteria bacterium]
MAILKIVTIPDPILRKKLASVKNINKKMVQLAHDMLETMYNAPGIGLAANQVGFDYQLAVIDATRSPEEKGKNPIILFNPKLLEKKGKIINDEGCLSIPRIYDRVMRAQKVKVSYQNEHGKEKIIEADGLLAQALQHEIDHLNGNLYIDLLSSLKRNLILKKYKKLKNEKK